MRELSVLGLISTNDPVVPHVSHNPMEAVGKVVMEVTPGGLLAGKGLRSEDEDEGEGDVKQHLDRWLAGQTLLQKLEKSTRGRFIDICRALPTRHSRLDCKDLHVRRSGKSETGCGNDYLLFFWIYPADTQIKNPFHMGKYTREKIMLFLMVASSDHELFGLGFQPQNSPLMGETLACKVRGRGSHTKRLESAIRALNWVFPCIFAKSPKFDLNLP